MKKDEELTELIENGFYVSSIISHIHRYLQKLPERKKHGIMRLCHEIDYHPVGDYDHSWGCGYRNTQMLMSSLMNVPSICDNLATLGIFGIPSIHCIQERIEEAWKRGFDPEGAAYYKGKLVGSKKFIGAVEVYTFLSSLRISAKIVECQSSSDAAFKWLLDYFDRQGDASDEADRKTHHKGGAPFEKAEMHSSSTASSSTSPSSTLSTSLSSSSSSSSSLPQSSTDSSLILQETFCSPVFFQMEGHSKTVIGVDRCSVENVALLMLDPSTSTQYMKLPEIGKTINSLRHSKERFKKYGKKLQMLFVDSLTPLSDEVMEVRKTPRAIARL